MSQPKKPPVDLELLTSLAKRFADRDMFGEAQELFQLALRFEPANLGIKLNLAQVRNQRKRTQGHSRRDFEEVLREQFRRNAIDSAHFFGLAALYEERGKPELAAECLDIARRKEYANPFVHKLMGKLLFRRKEYDEAGKELRRAQRFNPFDREIAELLGRVEYEREHYQEALEATIDAFLLLREDDREGSNKLKKRISTLKTIRKVGSDALVSLFRERQEKLQTSFDRLDLQRERFLLNDNSADLTAEPSPDPHQGRIELAARLRALDIWSDLDDEQIFHLTQAAREEPYPEHTKIFDFRGEGADLYILERGSISIRRPTSYGDFELGVLGAGTVYGEVNFISRSERSAEALALEPCHLIRFDADELEEVVSQHPDLGVNLYKSFWHGLAHKLRGANEQLRTFFSADSASENFLKLRRAERTEAGTVDVHSDDKIQLFREQGLTGAELSTLANFSKVKRYPSGTFLFHEGDEGKEMYVVLEGRVMISKYIPGGGEEALAILERGDFFGEMSLIDGEPRSADAKAFEGPLTVIAFDDRTLSEVIEMDANAALEFMALLCRLISERLREIDEKVTSWRIMSGVQPGEETLPPAEEEAPRGA